MSIVDICTQFNITLSEFFAETPADIQNNLENRLLLATKKMPQDVLESLVVLAEKMTETHTDDKI